MSGLTISENRELRTIELPDFGLLTLGIITFGGLERAESAAEEAPEGEKGRTFLCALVEASANDPKLSRDQVVALSENALGVLAADLTEQLDVQAEYSTTDISLPSYDRLRAAWKAHWPSMFEELAHQALFVLDEVNSSIAKEHAGALSKLGEMNFDFPKLDLLELTRAASAFGAIEENMRGVNLMEEAIRPAWIAQVEDSLKSVAQIGDLMAARTFPAIDEAMRSAELFGEAVKPAWLAQLDETANLGTKISDLVGRLAIPEPYLSGALIASGVNSPRIHSPEYILPPPPDYSSPSELRSAAADAPRHRRIDAFDTLDQLERSVRKFIERLLRKEHGEEWWSKGVPKHIRVQCEKRKLEKERIGEKEHEPIAYAYIAELGGIVTEGKNWNSVFHGYFRYRNETEVAFVRCNRVRPNIAHSRDLSDEEYTMFTFEAHRLIRLIEN